MLIFKAKINTTPVTLNRINSPSYFGWIEITALEVEEMQKGAVGYCKTYALTVSKIHPFVRRPIT